MTISAMKVSRWMLGAAVGIACLFVGDNASTRDDAGLVARANAAQTARHVAGVARRTPRRVAVVRGTIPLDLGYSASSATFYGGYAPGGSYGGLGCYRTYRALVCPP